MNISFFGEIKAEIMTEIKAASRLEYRAAKIKDTELQWSNIYIVQYQFDIDMLHQMISPLCKVQHALISHAAVSWMEGWPPVLSMQ